MQQFTPPPRPTIDAAPRPIRRPCRLRQIIPRPIHHQLYRPAHRQHVRRGRRIIHVLHQVPRVAYAPLSPARHDKASPPCAPPASCTRRIVVQIALRLCRSPADRHHADTPDKFRAMFTAAARVRIPNPNSPAPARSSPPAPKPHAPIPHPATVSIAHEFPGPIGSVPGKPAPPRWFTCTSFASGNPNCASNILRSVAIRQDPHKHPPPRSSAPTHPPPPSRIESDSNRTPGERDAGVKTALKVINAQCAYSAAATFLETHAPPPTKRTRDSSPSTIPACTADPARFPRRVLPSLCRDNFDISILATTLNNASSPTLRQWLEYGIPLWGVSHSISASAICGSSPAT